MEVFILAYLTIWEETTFEVRGVRFETIQYPRGFICYTFYVNRVSDLNPLDHLVGLLLDHINLQII